MKKKILSLTGLIALLALSGCQSKKVAYDPDNFLPTGDKIVKERKRGKNL